jgi:predicted nucleotidyltransferase component of viral defense system
MLQTRTVEPGTLGLLKDLMCIRQLDQFYLVGGTALALQLGHRFSVDLDLFTPQPFDKTELLDTLNGTFDIMVETEGTSMLITNINAIKVDFVKMSYPVLFPPIITEGVRMLDIKDIAPMKLKAVTQRGSKKDFYDIYYLMEHLSIDEMLGLFKEKFRQHEVFHVIKSLSYFEDAENYPDPQIFDPSLTWETVKISIRRAVSNMIH